MYVYSACCVSSPGNSRSSNEDNLFFAKKHLPEENRGIEVPLQSNGKTDDAAVFAVFDGMGGEKNGAMAACCAAEIFSDEAKKLEELVVSGKSFFIEACNRANKRIGEIIAEEQISRMGTTVAALYLLGDEVVSCNVGDSKVFRIRDNAMVQISEDHTDERILSAMGVSKKPVLLQYLGVPENEMMLDPYISKGELKNDDVYVLCSDGVTEAWDMEELFALISGEMPEKAARAIVSRAKQAPDTDNTTVIIIKICGQEE